MTRPARRDLRRAVFVAAVVLTAIILPFAVWGASIEAWARGALARGVPPAAAAAAVVGLLAGDVVLPVPSSFVSTAAGSLLGFVGGTAASWVGMTISCGAGYWLGLRCSGVQAGPHNADIEPLAGRLGLWLVAAMRPVPVLAEAAVFYAGRARMPVWAFLGMASVSNLGVSAAYAALGATAATRGAFLWAFGGAVALPGLVLLAARGIRQTGLADGSAE